MTEPDLSTSSHDRHPVTTTDSGIPAASDEYSLTVGPSGPTVLHDHYVVQKMQHFNRERVPERVVHAKGTGAHGFFEVTEDVTEFTKASFLAHVGKRTPVFARFSTVAGEQGFPDTVRDPRGFALKLYTDEGNYDLVGNNTPVFFVRDATKFQDFIHSQKRLPDTGLRSNDMQWDFWTLSPESAHQVAILMSDRGTPRSLRTMNGYGSHTFSWINAGGERFWVKYHFKTVQGVESFTDAEAKAMTAEDPDFHRRDLWESIAGGETPEWRLEMQVMPFEEAADYRFNPFDLTKVWPHGDYPLIEVGVLELNRNPENYFAEVEQAALTPANIVPGVGHSPDKMLQARIFSYGDAHRYRVGVNAEQLPVNKPRCPVNTYHADGTMKLAGPANPDAYYEPNSMNGPAEDSSFREPPLAIDGAADRYNHRDGNDDYRQPGDLFRLMNADQKQQLFNNIAAAMQGVPLEIVRRQLAHFHRADPAYAQGVAKALGLSEKEIPTAQAAE